MAPFHSEGAADAALTTAGTLALPEAQTATDLLSRRRRLGRERPSQFRIGEAKEKEGGRVSALRIRRMRRARKWVAMRLSASPGPDRRRPPPRLSACPLHSPFLGTLTSSRLGRVRAQALDAPRRPGLLSRSSSRLDGRGPEDLGRSEGIRPEGLLSRSESLRRHCDCDKF